MQTQAAITLKVTNLTPSAVDSAAALAQRFLAGVKNKNTLRRQRTNLKSSEAKGGSQRSREWYRQSRNQRSGNTYVLSARQRICRPPLVCRPVLSPWQVRGQVRCWLPGLSPPRRRRTRTSGLSDDLRACIGPEAGGHVRRLSRAVVDRSVMATLDELCERRQQSCIRCPDRQFRWLGLQLSGRWIRPNAARLEGLPQAEPLGPSSNGWLQSAKRPQGIRVLTLVAFWSRGLL